MKTVFYSNLILLIVSFLNLTHNLTPFNQFEKNINSYQQSSIEKLSINNPLKIQAINNEPKICKVILSANDFLAGSVEQIGIDVKVTIVDINNHIVLEMDSANDKYGPEWFYFIAPNTGEYFLIVQPSVITKNSSYIISINKLQPATVKDIERVSALKDFSDGNQFYGARNNTDRTLIDKALEKYQSALAKLNGLHEEQVEALIFASLGLTHDALITFDPINEKQKALECYSQAITRLNAVKQYYTAVEIKTNIAAIYYQNSQYDLAMKCNIETLPFYQQTDQKDYEIITLGAIGFCHYYLDNNQNALDYFDQQLKVAQLTGSKEGEGFAYYGMGMVYADLENWDLALNYYKLALPLRQIESVFNNYGSGKATVLANMAYSYHGQGEFQLALDNYNEALKIIQAINFKGAEAEILNNIGTVYDSKKDYQLALKYFQESFMIADEINDTLKKAVVLNNIGALFVSIGEYQKALENFNRALPLFQQIKFRDGETTTLYCIANIASQQNDLFKAKEYIEEAIALIENLQKSYKNKDLRSIFLTKAYNYHLLYIDILMKLHKQYPEENYDQLALTKSEYSRGRTLLETLSETRIKVDNVDPVLLQKENRLCEQTNDNISAISSLKNSDSNSQQGKLIQQLTRDNIELNRDLIEIRSLISEKNPRIAQVIYPEPIDLTGIQKLLDQRSLLIEYSLGEENSYIWLVTTDKLFSYQLPKRAIIDELAREAYSLLIVRENDSATKEELKSADAQFKIVAQQLSNILLSPIADKLENKNLYIVADGLLQYIPFAALPLAPKSSITATNIDKYYPLIKDHVIINLPSATTLLLIQKKRTQEIKALKSIALITNPVYVLSNSKGKPKLHDSIKSTDGNRESVYMVQLLGQDILKPIPGTELLVSVIKHFVSPPKRAIFTGYAANRSLVLGGKLKKFDIINFSSHSFLDTSNPEFSGLYLSLYDKYNKPVNGYLSVFDIYNLDLPVELVVLNGCRTGLGLQPQLLNRRTNSSQLNRVRSEAIVGLTRGFICAGTPRVITTLWAIRDTSSSILLSKFYKLVLGKKHLSPAEALRLAQLELLNDLKLNSPYYWAAFIIQGEQ